MVILNNQNGVAFLTVVFALLILTVLGIASITVTSLENRMAGFVRNSEAGVIAAESCMGTAVNVIQQTMVPPGVLPAAFLDNAVPPGPVPNLNGPTLQAEILGQPLPAPAAPNTPSENNPDVAIGAGAVPNLSLSGPLAVGAFAVTGDIDRMYARPKSGSGMQQFAGYDSQGAINAGVDFMYQINCWARNVPTGTTSHIAAVYSCTATGESCQKKPL